MDRKDFLRAGLASVGAAIVPHVKEPETVAIPAFADGQTIKVYAPEDGAIFHVTYPRFTVNESQYQEVAKRLEEIRDVYLKRTGRRITFILSQEQLSINPLGVESECTCGEDDECHRPDCRGYPASAFSASEHAKSLAGGAAS